MLFTGMKRPGSRRRLGGSVLLVLALSVTAARHAEAGSYFGYHHGYSGSPYHGHYRHGHFGGCGATLLITSHDRRFLETVATRFMWIRDGGLEETTRPEEFFASSDTRRTATLKVPRETAQRSVSEDVLERIVEIEEKLDADRARKLKFQKPKLQAAWEAELEALHKRLGEDSS